MQIPSQKLPKGESVSLHVDNLDPEELRIMFDFLAKCTSIEHAHIDVGKIPTKRAYRQKLMRLSLDEPYAMMPPGYMKIVRSISIMASKATELVSLHLAGIRIPLEVASDLAHGLQGCRALQSINLEGSQLGDSGLDILEERLASRPSLCHLGLAHCKLTDVSARPLARILRTQAARRDEMYWSTTLRGQTVPNRGEGCFLLNVASNALGDGATDVLCHALYNDNWLYGLNLSENNIGPRGVLNFADSLQTNTTLTVLLLQHNTNTDDRVSSFVNTLLQDRQMATTKQTSMNHPMEHTLLKAVLKSWGCLRRTADDDLLAKLLSKRTKTTSVASKVDHRGGKVLRRSSAPSIGGKAPLTKSSSSLRPARPALSSVPKASKVKSGGPKAAKKTILTKSSVKHAKHTAATTSSLKIGKQCPLTLQPERDGVTALDMLLNEQSVFRSNQEDPAVVVAAPAKRLDQQMLIKLMERISTLETAQANAQQHIDRVEAENLALKQKVATVVADPKPVDASTADMIQALESAIGHLTTQVSQLETTHKTSSKRQAEDTSSFTDAMLDDLSLQLKRSFGLDE
ncbi:hypothetical protein H257_13535 [Aphanomyces astaci]|uniref:Uncharacterized protein n=1 Tax=Aphanomyces astaci TaxID=112090 RepID=W4FWX5_APHAT|nr:hypothetical protein H257_13535 [Aphanomyces astaci]ETV71138.1 hypothetical protein H257_13535 [Aphanomyces astaci]|eukprot:XP_009839384.1 hypothetical protein H257_13535 [Aphanomyces astaci]